MKIFISWSGELSWVIARLIRQWLPSVLQSLDYPYVSSIDIAKGDRWFSSIAAELQKANYGIIVVTRRNKTEPWLHFEAGALANATEKRYVTPLLVDVTPDEIEGPLTQLQMTKVNREDLFQLVSNINERLQANRLEPVRLRESFDRGWSEFESKFSDIQNSAIFGTGTKLRLTDRVILEEVRTLVRGLASAELRRSAMLGEDPFEKELREVVNKHFEELGFEPPNVKKDEQYNN